MPQRQKTEPQDVDATDLPELTPQQMKFVEGVLAGQKPVDAYKAAYDVSEWKYNSVTAAASRLMANADVMQFLAVARQACLGSAVVTLEGHMQQLERIREIALKSGNIGAAVAAEQSRGKAAGHYVDQVRDVTDRFDPAQTLREIAVHSPELAASLAAQHGLEMPADGVTKH